MNHLSPGKPEFKGVVFYLVIIICREKRSVVSIWSCHEPYIIHELFTNNLLNPNSPEVCLLTITMTLGHPSTSLSCEKGRPYPYTTKENERRSWTQPTNLTLDGESKKYLSPTPSPCPSGVPTLTSHPG